MPILGFNGRFQTTYPSNPKQKRIGLFTNPLSTDTYVNVAGDLPKIVVLALSSASGNQVITIDDVTITVPYTTSDAATAAAIARAINSEYAPSVGGTLPGIAIATKVSATVSTATVTITGNFKGDSFTISYSGTGGTLTQDGTGGSQVAVVSSDIEFGLAIGANAADLTGWTAPNLPCRLPNASTTRIWGVSGGSVYTPYRSSDRVVPSYGRGDMVAAIDKGQVTVQLDTNLTVVPGDSVYYRHTANGVLTKLGAFANASGTGLAQLAGAKFVSANYSIDGINAAEIRI